jgi:methionyl-tRNA synthetase
VIVVANLEPATLMGIQSNGMVLTASQDGPFGLLAVDRDVPSGAKVR